MSSYVQNLRDLQRLLEEKPEAVLMFTATWCPPCKRLKPLFYRLAEAFGGSVSFGLVDVDATPEIAEQFQIASMPTFIFLRRGVTASGGTPQSYTVVRELRGPNETTLEAAVQQFIYR